MKFFTFIFAAFLIPPALHAAGIDMDAPKNITAQKIEYNVKSSDIKTTGKTEISNISGQKITLIDSYIGNKGATASGEDIELWLGKNVYITAESITRAAPETISKNAVFTVCYDCDTYGNAWEISTSSIKHNMDDHMMKFYSPVLWAYGVPIFWFPFLEIPDPSIKRKSGLLLPSFNST
ncbi:MAG: hypothetical protein LBF28_01775, partial [Rickettsiales bacterium]|nr:hypothetical protein [Rickettsiales bacterium]